MARARSFLVIAGVVALFPVGFAAARVIEATIVRPLLRHLYVIDTTGEEAPSTVCSFRNQARIVPFFENGVPSGFRVLAIPPGSIYRRLGVENGDVIRRINGNRLDSPDKALELYSKLRHEKWIDVELERGGRPVLNVYRID